MNPFALSGLLAFITSLSLGIFSLIKGKKFLHKIWSAFNLSVAIWGLGAFKFSTSLDKEVVFFWLRLGHIGVVLLPVFFIHFVFELLEIRKKKVLYSVYAVGLIFFILNITDWLGITKVFIVNLRYVFNSFYVDSPPGPLYPFFVAFFFWGVIYGHYYLIKFLRVSNVQKRLQIKYILLGTGIGFAGGGTTFLMVFNIDVYPILHFTVPLYPIIMTYAMFKYRLMDINVVFKRSLVYSLLVASITLIYFVIVWFLERFFQTVMGYRSIPMTVFALLTIALFFQPLKNHIQRFVDLYFFKGTVESLAEEKEKLQEEVRRSDQLRVAGMLASGIAHEIKNPITAIKTFITYLPEKRSDDTFIKKFQDVAGAELNRIEGLLKDLLDFARPKPPRLEKIDIDNLLNRTLQIVSHDLSVKNIHIAKSS